MYEFQCVTASYMLSLFTDDLKIIDDKLSREVRNVILTQFPDRCPEELFVFLDKYWRDLSSEAGVVMNTCKEIDGEFIELMPHFQRAVATTIAESVVYVSFGSTVSISDEQIEQLALGLLHSRQRFIWVLKDADKGDIFADNENSTKQRKLPSGFEESTSETGVVVRGWAPQLEILAHPSTGVFVSHCGWNSCIESLSFGVPMIAWPMHSDQPRNATMVCEYLKAGVLVRGWDQETVSGSEVERAIERMMGTDDEGKEIRKRAKGLGEEIRGAVKENGSSKAEFDSFVQHITR
ncbi:zeatin O-xylosyltransferase-like [Asparagus officinalis]|uniref:zeatin O-xylosyltransferase-like n=1 Tax=Asparagus officinalis TaxID=4686 RepID=UPI00098E7222|nr:zeatin O-xylosyltransferase-like [Asparagus officinalis]